MEPASDSESVDILQYPIRDELFSVCQPSYGHLFSLSLPSYLFFAVCQQKLSFSFSLPLLLSLTTSTTATTILRIQVRIWMIISLCHEAAVSPLHTGCAVHADSKLRDLVRTC